NWGKMIPVQRHGQLSRDQKITAEKWRPFDARIECICESLDRLQPLIRATARIGKRNNVVALEDSAGSPAKLGQARRFDAMKLVDAQTKLPGKTRVVQFGQ